MTIDLTPILQAGLGLLAAFITAKLIPWIKSKTTAQQQATLGVVVDVLVYAAEQLYDSHQIQDKLGYVKAQLAERGYAVDIAQIEAAVKKMSTDNKNTTVINLPFNTANNIDDVKSQ